MTKTYDIIIIGGGNAGFGVSTIAHNAGKNIAFIEEWDFGGTCPNRGCTPKKVLVAAAQALHEIETASAHGISVENVKLDWRYLIEREKGMIRFIPDTMEKSAASRGDVYRGTARFTGPNSVEVDGTVLTAKDIVIATGSKPRRLPISGAELMMTSDEVLFDQTLPEEITFVGGGVIAFELGHVFVRAGVKVTILEALPRLLPRMDEDAVSVLVNESERIGLTIKTGVRVNSIAQSGDRLEITYEHDGGAHTLTTDRVVNGAGRVANVDRLNLETGNVAHTNFAIATDQYLRSTSNPSVWVGGDALSGSPQLSPIATYEGRLIGENIVNGATKQVDYSVVPSSIYTVPALSSVGLSEAEAKDLGLNLAVTTSDISGWFSAKTYAETAAWSKVLIDKSSDKIVGAHIVGHKGEELIHLFALAMRHGISAKDLTSSIYAFPTFSADIKSMVG